ncbi:MAG: helix-turn-helix domain-containing protein [Blastococcus sp.]
MEVLRRYSNNYAVTQRVQRLSRHLAAHPSGAAPPPRAPYRPHRLSQRLDAATVDAIITAYQAGTTAKDLAERYGVARSAITRLRHRHGVAVRRRSPTAADRQRMVALRHAGLSRPAIAAQIGFSVSTVSRVLARTRRLD